VLSVAAKRLEELGFQVFQAPEVSTLFCGAGCAYPFKASAEHRLNWESVKMKTQLGLEDSLMELAESSGLPTVILLDRSLPDSQAYAAPVDFETILDRNDWSLNTMMKRYDLVIHMVTTAIGAEDFYSLENDARTETPEEAREIDDKIRAAWLAHPKVIRIDNKSDFEDKTQRVMAKIFEAVGLQTPQAHRLLFHLPDGPPPAAAMAALENVEFNITTTFLHDDVTDEGLRDRVVVRRARLGGSGGTPQYVLAECVALPSPVESEPRRVVLEKGITGRQYGDLLTQQDASWKTVVKTRVVFLHGRRCYRLDMFKDGPTLLSIECNQGTDEESVTLPEAFAGLRRELVEDENAFSLRHLAMRDNTPNKGEKRSSQEFSVHF